MEAIAAGIDPTGSAAMPWRQFLQLHFAAYVRAPFADRHVRFWEWLTGLQPGVRPRPRVEAWPRGGAKSTTIELGCVWLGSQPHPSRHFVLYVSETQAQADKHVQAIASGLERVGVQRAVNQYGASKGWKRTEIRAANGFNVVAFGLDSGMRGVKLDEFRPDVIIFDDIDSRHDTPATVQKKVDVITETVLPAESPDVAIIVVQNLIHENSIMAQLVDGRADFLHDRLPPTVEPAVRDLQVERRIADDGTPRYVITGGTATWEGQNLQTCEQQINSWGLTAFLREAQHEVEDTTGGLWDRAADIDPFRYDQRRHGSLPELDRVVVAIDPNTSANAAEAGIIVAGTSWYWDRRQTTKPHAYVLADRTVSGGPDEWAAAVVAAWRDFRADDILAEVNNGGDMVAMTIGTVSDVPPVRVVHASRGKRTRAEPVQKLYADGRVHHVGVFPELERQMTRWVPGNDSPDRMDALVWAITDLLLGDDDWSELADYERLVFGGSAY